MSSGVVYQSWMFLKVMEQNSSRSLTFECSQQLNNHVMECHIGIDLCILLPCNPFETKLNLRTASEIFFL